MLADMSWYRRKHSALLKPCLVERMFASGWDWTQEVKSSSSVMKRNCIGRVRALLGTTRMSPSTRAVYIFCGITNLTGSSREQVAHASVLGMVARISTQTRAAEASPSVPSRLPAPDRRSSLCPILSAAWRGRRQDPVCPSLRLELDAAFSAWPQTRMICRESRARGACRLPSCWPSMPAQDMFIDKDRHLLCRARAGRTSPASRRACPLTRCLWSRTLLVPHW